MKVLGKLKDKNNNEGYAFYCPACEENHIVYIKGVKVPLWRFDGNEESPTFSPSVKVVYKGKPKNTICHFYIKNGTIMYLKDCTHRFAGKTILMEEWV